MSWLDMQRSITLHPPHIDCTLRLGHRTWSAQDACRGWGVHHDFPPDSLQTDFRTWTLPYALAVRGSDLTIDLDPQSSGIPAPVSLSRRLWLRQSCLDHSFADQLFQQSLLSDQLKPSPQCSQPSSSRSCKSRTSRQYG